MTSKGRIPALLIAVLLMLSALSAEQGTNVIRILMGLAGCQTVYSVHGLEHDCVRVVRNAETVEEAAETVLTSADAVKQAFEAIQSGQVLRLDVPKVVLNATLLITTSNVEVRGRPERTRMLCPSDGSALIIRFVTSGC